MPTVRHTYKCPFCMQVFCLVGLVVKASALKVADLGFHSCLQRGDFSGLSHISDLKIGPPVAMLPGAWC